MMKDLFPVAWEEQEIHIVNQQLNVLHKRACFQTTFAAHEYFIIPSTVDVDDMDMLYRVPSATGPKSEIHERTTAHL